MIKSENFTSEFTNSNLFSKILSKLLISPEDNLKEDFLIYSIKELLLYACKSNRENLKNLKEYASNIIFKIIYFNYEKMILVPEKKNLISINYIFHSMIESKNVYFFEIFNKNFQIINFFLKASFKESDKTDDELFLIFSILKILWFKGDENIQNVNQKNKSLF
jgi:hypothetical protein